MTSDRSLKTKRVPDPSHFSKAHASGSKGGRRAGHVCHISQPTRHIPPHLDARGLIRIPRLSSQRQAIHVHGSSRRSQDSSMGLHRWYNKKNLVIKSPPDPFPIPRRLVESVQVPGLGEGVDIASSETVRAAGTVSESGEIRASAYAIHRIPRREARSGTWSRVSNGKATSSGVPRTRTSSVTSGSRIPSRGVSVGTVVNDGAYHTTG